MPGSSNAAGEFVRGVDDAHDDIQPGLVARAENHYRSRRQAAHRHQRMKLPPASLQHESNPGDAVFFHCNLLHRSDQNRSDLARWSLICCYNAASNDPYKESHHPRYSPLPKVADDAIKKWQPPRPAMK